MCQPQVAVMQDKDCTCTRANTCHEPRPGMRTNNMSSFVCVCARALACACACVPSRRDKGLRSFSLKVCQKVEERDVTTYNEVSFPTTTNPAPLHCYACPCTAASERRSWK